MRYKLLGKRGSAMGSNDEKAMSWKPNAFSCLGWCAIRSFRMNVNSCRVFAAYNHCQCMNLLWSQGYLPVLELQYVYLS